MVFLKKNLAGKAICAIIIFLFLITCSEKDDVLAIRELIREGAALAEDHDVGGIIDLTTEDLVGYPGQVNRMEIKRIIWRAFRHYGKLKVLFPKPSVDISAENQTAACKVYLLIVKRDQTKQVVNK